MPHTVIDRHARAEPAAVHAAEALGTSGESTILANARQRAVHNGLAYAGSVTPAEAWALFTQGDIRNVRLIDVRSAEELKFVGRVPDSQHVAWMSGISLSRNPRFTKELEAKARKDEVVLLLCRSGKRSAAAAEAAAKAGFLHVFNVLEGFEGDLDEQQRRGAFNGWRHAALPWVQD
jgi:rhodanese-related sulfurtransferase